MPGTFLVILQVFHVSRTCGNPEMTDVVANFWASELLCTTLQLNKSAFSILVTYDMHGQGQI